MACRSKARALLISGRKINTHSSAVKVRRILIAFRRKAKVECEMEQRLHESARVWRRPWLLPAEELS